MTELAERSKTATAARILCLELYRLDAGRIERWHSGTAIEKAAGLDQTDVMEAWRHAKAQRWVETSHAPEEGVGQVMLTGIGRRVVEAALTAPGKRSKA